MLRFITTCRTVIASATLAFTFGMATDALAQTTRPGAQPAGSASPAVKKVLGVDDYSKWRTIDGAQISANGRWVASVLRHTNVLPNDAKPELHLRNLDTDANVVIAHASNPTFSADSRWIVYQVDSMPQRAPAGRGGRAGGAGADSAPAHVSFSEGMNFYNALRYNGKDAVMLAYPGEGHGLRGLANRRDLTERYFQFFDHYLKGAPAPKWMTDGVPFLAKDLPRIVP